MSERRVGCVRRARQGVAGVLAACSAVALVGAQGCSGSNKPLEPDLQAIYGPSATGLEKDRTPVIVIPGILGSKLEHEGSERLAWGALTYRDARVADADRPYSRRVLSVPMRTGVPLSELDDDVRAVGVLDDLTVDTALFVRGLRFAAYRGILETLGVGNYVDREIIEGGGTSDSFFAGGVDYGGLHYTCFQYPYDWRRDVSEAAVQLGAQVRAAQAAVRLARGLGADAPVKVDVVAHSMGGMVLRYYLRYGEQPLPEDGSLPELTWAGAASVERAVIVGTPSGGAVLSLRQLVEGWNTAPVGPNYRASLLGTMPAIYQLLPRTRHARVIDGSGAAVDLFTVETWTSLGWGLADPDEDDVLKDLLPDEPTAEGRRAVALDHLAKCLAKAEQLHRALDVPARAPEGLDLVLFAGDAVATADVLRVDASGRLTVVSEAPGDGTVTRASAFMDERTGGGWRPGVASPERWASVYFVPARHLDLTSHPTFSDNLLYLLLEKPRD